jgi:ribosomal protein S18 acetylase RimI-like enzyme
MNQEQLETIFRMPDGLNIRIRPARANDLPGMEWDGEYAHFRKLYRQHFQNSRTGYTRIWVAETEAGEIIGQVFLLLYSRQNELADGLHRAYMFSFRVKPDFRNHGLGGFMIEFVENYLLTLGFDTVRLNVGRDNEQARHLYEKHGYKVVGPEEGRWRYEDQFGRWQHVHEPAWRMIKNLKQNSSKTERSD